MLQRYAEWSGALAADAPDKKDRTDPPRGLATVARRQQPDRTRARGRQGPISARLARYVTTQPGVQRDAMQKIIYADLRYNNGYAIRMTGTDLQDRP
jgi:cell division protein FtsQ